MRETFPSLILHLNEALCNMDSVTPLEEVIERISSGAKTVTVSGLAGSSKAYLLQLILRGTNKTFVYLGTGGKEAVRFLRDLQFHLGPLAEGEVYLFPPHDVLPFSKLSPHNDIICDRLQTLFSLRKKPPPLFISTTASALLSFLPPREALEPWILKAGEKKGREIVLKKLTEWGYQNAPLVIDRGNYAVRGSIVDLFSPIDRQPVRIEWSGDAIESIRTFDAVNQRSREARSETILIPAREISLTEETIRHFSERARAVAEAKDLSRSSWAPLTEKIKGQIPFAGMETYLSLFYKQASTFLDWLPGETVLIAEDFNRLRQTIAEHFSDITPLLSEKEDLLSPQEALVTEEGFFKGLENFQRLSFPTVTEPTGFQFATETHQTMRREIQLARKGLEPLAPLAKRIKTWLETEAVLLVTASEPRAKRLADLLQPYFSRTIPIDQGTWTADKPEPSSLRIVIGDLSTGYRLPSEGITVLTEEEIFGQKVRRREREAAGEFKLSSFAELKEGDPIVHKDHGIGIYRGLKHMAIEGHETDFLLIEYQGADKLYLPVYRLNLVQRYVGGDARGPRVDKLGGTAWAKVRGKSEKAIRELAGELLNLYAARTAGKGFAFSPPNELFEAFESSFPYEETPDQEQAITEVLQDMQNEKPMDRLVLGDVGYGKTEVALRAAFKAILDGKQVAFLVPTTLLAFQHYDRITERFRDYPVTVDMLSRFRSSSEQKKTVRDLTEGKVDLIIGTHRLLQPDLSFKDLGLLIIDEEHRFGVEQKEKIKRLRKDVDLLALSATPIPRTLYMSLVGVRALSVIETPPTDRLSIRTFVMPFEESVIREAILKELKRGGQVYFVHNEVETIGKIQDLLKRLVPEAKSEIAHGQMEEKSLEEIMIRFFHQEFNLLLCTTIIESGIDIPTANTILINDATRLGLAQVYQLRGRVGRGSHRAYAYLLVPTEREMTEEAGQRLSALQRFSELGSGYKLASYDLEIRGAGNLLGREQSGHMTALGYELYTELLEEAIREVKGEKVLKEIDPELHFKVPSFLPEGYLPDPAVRLEIYRRLASLDSPNSDDQLDAIRQELEDRFGPITEPVANLLELSSIRSLAKNLRIKQIRYDGKTFVYAFDPSSPLPPDLLTQRIKKEPKKYRLTPDFRFSVHQPLSKGEEALEAGKKFLRELVLHLPGT